MPADPTRCSLGLSPLKHLQALWCTLPPNRPDCAPDLVVGSPGRRLAGTIFIPPRREGRSVQHRSADIAAHPANLTEPRTSEEDVAVKGAQHTAAEATHAPHTGSADPTCRLHPAEAFAQRAPLQRGTGETRVEGSPPPTVSSLTPACARRHRQARSPARPSTPRLRRTASSPVSANSRGSSRRSPDSATPCGSERIDQAPGRSQGSHDASVKGLLLRGFGTTVALPPNGRVSRAPSRTSPRFGGSKAPGIPAFPAAPRDLWSHQSPSLLPLNARRGLADRVGTDTHAGVPYAACLPKKTCRTRCPARIVRAPPR